MITEKIGVTRDRYPPLPPFATLSYALYFGHLLVNRLQRLDGLPLVTSAFYRSVQ